MDIIECSEKYAVALRQALACPMDKDLPVAQGRF